MQVSLLVMYSIILMINDNKTILTFSENILEKTWNIGHFKESLIFVALLLVLALYILPEK